MDNSPESGWNAGQRLGSGSGSRELPPALLDKIREVQRLLGEINREAGMPLFGPVGGPLGPLGGPVGGPLGPVELIEDFLSKFTLDQLIDELRHRQSKPKPGIRIAGVETTQSIQFFNVDGTGSGAGADNSVPLIANKPLLLRVYVEKRTGVVSYVPERVTGRVRVGGQEFTPLNGPLRLQEHPLVKRAQLGHTLNFRIPAAMCRGTRIFEVRVFDAAATPFGSVGIYIDGSTIPSSSTSDSIALTFRDVPLLRVTGVMVNYVGPPNFNVAAPVGTDLVDSLMRFLPMFPLHGFDFGPCTMTPWGEDLTIKTGEKLSGWDSLLNMISNLRSASTIPAIYVGLLPAGLPGLLNAPHQGIGRPGVAIAAKDATRALSHELGHALWLDHVNAGGPAGPFDNNYPKYLDGTLPFGSIGECGVNTARMTLFNPVTSGDLMTYLDPADVPFPALAWISPYNYQRLMNIVTATDGTGNIVAIIVVIGSAMLLNFRVHRNGKVEVLPSYAVTGLTSLETQRPIRPIVLDLLNREGEIIRSHRCHVHNPYQDEDGPYLDYHEVLNWSDEVKQVAVRQQGQVVDTIAVESQHPPIELEALDRVQRHGDLAKLKWLVKKAAKPLHAMIRYSHDDGRTWQALAAGLTESEFLVNLDLLPGGDRCRLEVISSSGLGTATAQTQPFAVPHKPRKATVVSPLEGETFRAGAAVRFVGGGYSPDGGTCGCDEVAWHSSLEHLLGTGYEVVRNDLRPGTHRITLSLPDGQGGEATASVWIRILEEDPGGADCG